MTSLSHVHPDPRQDRIIASAGEIYITVAKDRCSAIIRHNVTHEIYAVVHSAEKARAVLTRGVNEYEIYIGGSDFWSTYIVEMVSAIKRALLPEITV